jgi:hypothetical protein
MKKMNEKSRTHHIKRVEELVNENLSDYDTEDLYQKINYHDQNTKRMVVEIVDIEILREKLADLKMSQESDRNIMLVREQEIQRLEEKIILMEL